MVPYLSNFYRNLDMSFINHEISLLKRVIASIADGNQEAKFITTDTKFYVPAVTLSAQNNAKLLQQLNSGFKRTINWNKYEWKILTQVPKQYLDYLIDPSFQGVNRLFVLLFQNITGWILHTKYFFQPKIFLPAKEIKECNVMIDGKNFYDQPIKNDIGIYEQIRRIATDQKDGYTTGCLIDYNYSKNYYKMVTIDLSKQQAPDADPKAMQQINFTGSLENNSLIFFIIKEAK